MRPAIAGLLATVVVAVAAACGPVAVPRPLPADPAWQGQCGIGVGRQLILRGSPADPRLTWATDSESRERYEILWPVGHQARFGPSLEVLDADGMVVGRDGDQIIGSCSRDLVGRDVLLVDGNEIRGPDWQPGDG